jgi:BirA family biotin operon repressor/biotin-[acetyl-CoA-carboxylase] ligase
MMAKKRSIKKRTLQARVRSRRKDTRDLEVTILRELVKSRPGYMSGTALADRLKMSKVSIWARLQKLQEDGITIVAQRNRGYSLSKEPDKIHSELLTALLPEEWLHRVHGFAETKSTNLVASKYLVDGKEAPFVVTANRQGSGRGRMGNQWVSRDFRNLYISFGFRPDVLIKKLESFTLLVGISICEYLERTTQLPIQVKWPNDLYIDGRKVAGMLTESRIESEKVKDLVFGLGLNINGRMSLMPDSLKNKATTLAHETKHPLNMNELTAGLILKVNETYQACIHGELTLKNSNWDKYDYLQGKKVSVKSGNQILEGVCQGINDLGELLLVGESGDKIRCRAGEVTLSI